MNKIQKQIEYISLLRSISDAMDMFLVNAAIVNEEDAATSLYRSFLEKVHPDLRCLVYELDFSYGLKIKCPISSDKAVDSFIIAQNMYQEINKSPIFSKCKEMTNFESNALLKKLSNSENYIKQQKPEDQKKYYCWLNLLAQITNQNLEAVHVNRLDDLYFAIQDTCVADVIAQKAAHNPDNHFELLVENINEAIYESSKWFINQNLVPDSFTLSQDLFERLKENPQLNPQVLNKVIANNFEAVQILIDDQNQPFNNLRKLKRGLNNFRAQIEDKAAKPSELKEVLFANKISYAANSYDLRQHHKDDTKEISLRFAGVDFATHKEQKLYLQKYKTIFDEETHWNKYEKNHEIMSGSPLKKKLRSQILMALSAGCTKPGALHQRNYLEIYRDKVKGILAGRVTDQSMMKECVAFCEILTALDKGAQNYLGIHISNQKVDENYLQNITEKEKFNAMDFENISAYMRSIAQYLEQNQNQILSLQINDASLSLEDLSNLPDSLEKYQAIKTFWATASIRNNIINQEYHAAEANTNETFLLVHQNKFRQMRNKLVIMSEALPQIKNSDIKKLAQEINRQASQTAIFPFYATGSQTPKIKLEQFLSFGRDYDANTQKILGDFALNYALSAARQHYSFAADKQHNHENAKIIFEAVHKQSELGKELFQGQTQLCAIKKTLREQRYTFSKYQDYKRTRQSFTAGLNSEQHIIQHYVICYN